MPIKRRAIFLDRDGVLNDVVDRGERFEVCGKRVRWTAPFSLEEFHFRPAIIETLEAMRTLDFLRIVATNQPDVAYGLLAQAVNDCFMEMTHALPVDDVFVCYHTRYEDCSCKKSKPGMLLQAAAKWDIDLPRSYMIGDSATDLQAGEAAGCRTILIHGPQNETVVSERRAINLQAAFSMIKSDLHLHL